MRNETGSLDIHTINVLFRHLKIIQQDHKNTSAINGLDIALYEILFLKEKELEFIDDKIHPEIDINKFIDF